MKRIHVAVAVIFNERDEVLISQRPAHVHLGGLWEFPGGKVELNEMVTEALNRELVEELSIVIEDSLPLMVIEHDYPERKVLLDVHLVKQFSGVAKGVEGQEIKWVSVPKLQDYVFPVANEPIVDAVKEVVAAT